MAQKCGSKFLVKQVTYIKKKNYSSLGFEGGLENFIRIFWKIILLMRRFESQFVLYRYNPLWTLQDIFLHMHASSIEWSKNEVVSMITDDTARW